MTALRNADAAGDTEAAARIAGMIKAQKQPQQETGIEQPKVERFKKLLLKQARGEQGLDGEISSLQSELGQQQADRPERQAPQPTQEQWEQAGKGQDITDIFTGKSRMTPEIEAMPHLGTAPEFNEFSLSTIKANIGTFTTGDTEEIKKIFKKQYGDRISFTKDSKGNDIVNFPSGQYALNKPGFSPQDIPKFFGDLAAFTYAGRAGTVAGAAVKSGAGEAALEATDVLLGGDFSPQDVLLSAGLGGAFKGLEKGIANIYGRLKNIGDDIPATREALKSEMKKETADESLDQVADAIKKGTDEDLAKMVDADPRFYQAADEMGISTEPLASFASRNPQFVATESALASVPSSQLDVQSKAFIKEVSKRADDLIEGYGGTLDKGQLNVEFKRKAIEAIDDLASQADDAYGKIAQSLPKSKRFDAKETVSFINELAKDLGGVKELPTKIKTMLSRLKDKPTLGKIDQLRREVGQAINKKSGSFKDVESGLNKALYARLRTDQDLIAKNSGMGAVTDSANKLIIKRKQLEDNLKTLLGKDLNKALSINVAGSLKGLAKGDIQRFNQVMSAIPRNQRQEAVLTAMNDVFKGGGVNQQSLSTTQFVKWFESVGRSPTVKKRLMEELPRGARKAVTNLYVLAKGISKATSERVQTGRLNAMFNEETGFLRKMVGKTAPSVVALSTGSPTAAMITNSTVEFLKQGTSGAKRAAELLANDEFKALIRNAAKQGVMEGKAAVLQAEKSIAKNSIYQKWKNGLSKKQKKELENLGLVKYLFAFTSEERE